MRKYIRCRLGGLDPRPNYHTETALYPVGYEARFTDAKGATFTSAIRDGGDAGPLFCITLRPPDADLPFHVCLPTLLTKTSMA